MLRENPGGKRNGLVRRCGRTCGWAEGEPPRLSWRRRPCRDRRGDRGCNAVFERAGSRFRRRNAQGAAAPRRSARRAKGPQYLKFPGKHEGLVLLGDRPLVAETPESLLDDDTTPLDKFYIRNNGQIPDETKDPDAWKIVIDGSVEEHDRDHARRTEEEVRAVT